MFNRYEKFFLYLQLLRALRDKNSAWHWFLPANIVEKNLETLPCLIKGV